MDDRKHNATPQKRKKARQLGKIAHSPDLTMAVVFCAASALLSFCGPQIGVFVTDVCMESFHWTHAEGASGMGPEAALDHLRMRLVQALICLMPLLLGVLAIAFLANWLQLGTPFLASRLAVEPGRVNPVQGFQKLWRFENVSRVIMGVTKLVALGLVVGISCWRDAQTFQSASALSIESIADLAWTTLMRLCLAASVVYLASGAIEYAIAWRQHENSLRMTDEELRQELKELSGDPQLASRRRALREELRATKRVENEGLSAG